MPFHNKLILMLSIHEILTRALFNKDFWKISRKIVSDDLSFELGSIDMPQRSSHPNHIYPARQLLETHPAGSWNRFLVELVVETTEAKHAT